MASRSTPSRSTPSHTSPLLELLAMLGDDPERSIPDSTPPASPINAYARASKANTSKKEKKLGPSPDSIQRIHQLGGRVDRCMISRETGPRGSLEWEYLFCPKPKRHDDLVRKLSSAWGFDVQRGHLWRPDTPENMTLLLSTWRRSHRSQEWIMLPEQALLKEILRVCKTGFAGHYTSVIPNEVRKYTLVPLYRICDETLPVRQLAPMRDVAAHGRAAETVFARSSYPGLHVESHVHPFMAICDFMQQMPTCIDLMRLPVEFNPWTIIIERIWDVWMKVEVPTELLPPLPPSPEASPAALHSPLPTVVSTLVSEASSDSESDCASVSSDSAAPVWSGIHKRKAQQDPEAHSPKRSRASTSAAIVPRASTPDVTTNPPEVRQDGSTRSPKRRRTSDTEASAVVASGAPTVDRAPSSPKEQDDEAEDNRSPKRSRTSTSDGGSPAVVAPCAPTAGHTSQFSYVQQDENAHNRSPKRSRTSTSDADSPAVGAPCAPPPDPVPNPWAIPSSVDSCPRTPRRRGLRDAHSKHEPGDAVFVKSPSRPFRGTGRRPLVETNHW